MVKERYITIKTGHDGMHAYPNAPDEVDFLKNIHRHYFNITITIEVFHNEREIEFYMLYDNVNRYLDDVFGMSRSCEDYACEILNKLEEIYCIDKERKIKVCVGEDYQNQAEILNYIM